MTILVFAFNERQFDTWVSSRGYGSVEVSFDPGGLVYVTAMSDLLKVDDMKSAQCVFLTSWKENPAYRVATEDGRMWLDELIALDMSKRSPAAVPEPVKWRSRNVRYVPSTKVKEEPTPAQPYKRAIRVTE